MIVIDKFYNSENCILFTLKKKSIISIKNITIEIELQIELMKLIEENVTENENENEDI